MNHISSYNASIKLGRDSFPLYMDKPDSSVFGMLELTGTSPLVPPALELYTPRILLQLIGKEHMDTKILRTVIDNTYTIPSNEWQMVEVENRHNYQLRFAINIPSKVLPSSFQMLLERESVAIGVDYLLKVSVVFHENDDKLGEDWKKLSNAVDDDICKTNERQEGKELVIVHPVYFHRAYNHRKSSNSSFSPLLPVPSVIQHQRQQQQRWPSRVHWGAIFNQKQQQAWQYEVEYPNLFELDDDADGTTGYISIRLKPTTPRSLQRIGNSSREFWQKYPVHSDSSIPRGFCLVGYQVLQIVEIDGFQIYYQVLSASTECMKLAPFDNHQGWIQLCDINFDLVHPKQFYDHERRENSHNEDKGYFTLPTVPRSKYQSLAVNHCIKLTIALDDMSTVEMTFPISIIGYSTLSVLRKLPFAAASTNKIDIINNKPLDCPSSSSVYSVEGNTSQDSAIDVDSYRSSTSSASEKTITMSTTKKPSCSNTVTTTIIV
ncbi:hypothetical protein BDF20DRAFT_912806 [Mycotypha africana]|uniref:uncharacterized protein n=1 Tax=Mycotypha africana TaxID=64632 RepID=UPI0022FFE5C0|nr:uncharacterized protein BDF20DRAFT_912806 [Mycotypha africana]KAI8979180.1 hypothetical protein BDF20DRAFT_912806 [Mycotypha africana]